MFSYENLGKIIKCSSSILDVEVLKNMHYIIIEGEKEIAKGVKKIADMMEKVTRGSNRIKVETISKKESR